MDCRSSRQKIAAIFPGHHGNSGYGVRSADVSQLCQNSRTVLVSFVFTCMSTRLEAKRDTWRRRLEDNLEPSNPSNRRVTRSVDNTHLYPTARNQDTCFLLRSRGQAPGTKIRAFAAFAGTTVWLCACRCPRYEESSKTSVYTRRCGAASLLCIASRDTCTQQRAIVSVGNNVCTSRYCSVGCPQA